MAFAGKIYFTGSTGSLIRCYDTGTRVQTVVTPRDPRLTAGFNARFGANTVLEDGRLMNQGWYGIYETPTNQYMTGEIFPEGLNGNLAGTKNFHYQVTSPINRTNDDAQLDTIIWDETEQVYWTRHSLVPDDSGLWAATALNSNLDVVRHVGDCTLIPYLGDAYSGADNTGANADFLGRWYYHNLTYGDGIGRLNVDTGEWQAILNANSDGNGTACKLLGVDEVNGHFITVNLTQSYSPDYQGHLYWVQIRDPHGGDPWANPVPNGLGPGYSQRLGAPLVEYPIDPPEIHWRNNSPYLDDYYPNPVVITGGRMYFMVEGEWGTDYWDNPDGTGGGHDMFMWSMDLTNGSVQLEAEIPYGYFNSAGQPTTYNDPDYWSTNGGAYGLALVPIQLSITGQIDATRVRPYVG